MPEFLFVLDDLELICSTYCLQFWEVVGVWLASIGTLAAVIVSLVLARRPRPRLRVSAGQRVIVGNAFTTPPSVLAITVRNMGDRPVTVAGVGWRKSRWSKSQAYQTLSDNIGGFPMQTVPHRLPDGESTTFYVSLDDTEAAWLEHFARDFIRPNPKRGVRRVRVMVYTPTGETFYAPIEPGLRKLLLEEAERQRMAELAANKAQAESSTPAE